MVDILQDLVEDVKRKFLNDHAILSFNEYFAKTVEAPHVAVRSAARYMVDMIDFFGTESRELPTGKLTHYKVCDAPYNNGEGKVSGQDRVVESIYHSLNNFARQGRVNKLLVLHGPNGSAKSSIVRALVGGLEAYAREPEGAMYSFNWIFPAEKGSDERIGFGSERRSTAAKGSYAYTAADNIDARVPCDLHDHPLFLLPQEQRLKLLKQFFPSESEHTGLEYLRTGDLCYKCRRIYDALLASYDGDANKVLNHIQVERFYISKRYSRGASTVEPQVSVDARIQQLTSDRSLAALPKALHHVSLFDPAGPLVDANRGVLEFSDLLKRPVEAFKYLLSTVETATVCMESFVLHLDMIFIASTNEVYLDAFKQHPDFPSFKGRMQLIRVPYLLRMSEEIEIYRSQITERVVGRHIAPHAIEVATMWAVLTRMRRADSTLYPKAVSTVLTSLTPMEKLRLYDKAEAPERLTTRESAELRALIPELYEESQAYPNYEGRFGASAREVRGILLNAAHNDNYHCLTPLAVFDEIEEMLTNTTVHEFLNQDVVDGYHDHGAFLKASEEQLLDWLDDEVRDSMGLAERGSYAALFTRYVDHITYWVKDEKILDPASHTLLEPDERLMTEVETVLVAKEEAVEDFRRAVIATIGAKSLDDPGKKPDLEEVFAHYIQMLRENFFTSRRHELRAINENFLRYVSDENHDLDKKERAQVEQMLERLHDTYGYCKACARDMIAYLLKKRYAE